MAMQAWFQQQWQTKSLAHLLLVPMSWLFLAITTVRRFLYRVRILSSYHLAVPVIVVGNITVGGTGKTPFVIYLAEQLKLAGYTPGIISRGYGGSQTGQVFADSAPYMTGDEPVLMAKRTACPVWVNPDRVAAGQALLQAYPQCDVIISDDGLQHLRLQRDIEIVLVNAQALGNQYLLPAGPLRESVSRLSSVSYIVNSGEQALPIAVMDLPPQYHMQVYGDVFQSLTGGQTQHATLFKDKPISAIAAIGHPERFFSALTALGLKFERKVFPDHHPFKLQDFVDVLTHTIIMTEKDAVKCQSLPLTDAWYLPVTAEVTATHAQSLPSAVIATLTHMQQRKS